MNWLDLVFLMLIALNLIGGYRQGLVRQLIGLVGFLVSIPAAFYGSSLLGGVIAGYIDPGLLMPLQETSNRLGFNITVDRTVNLVAGIIAFLVLFVLIRALIGLLAGSFTAVNRLPVLGLLNRLAGLALGLARGLVLVLLLMGLFFLLPVNCIAGAMTGSTLVCIAESYIPSLVEGLKTLFLSYL